MKVIVLGTGMIGNTVVAQLAKSHVIDEVIAVDASQERLDRCLAYVNHPKVAAMAAVLGDQQTMTEVLRDADIAIQCLPHFLSLQATKAAIAAGCHLVDLVHTDYLQKRALNEAAKEAGVLVLPGCGVAPGIVNILASRGIDLMDEAEEAVMICGGIPRHPLPPLWYQLVFSMEGLLDMYQKSSLAAENGEVVHIPPFSGFEELTFPEPIGECEAVITDASTVPYTLKHKVKRIYEKTVRYKGHWTKIATLAELGFLSDTPVEVDGVRVSPRSLSAAILRPKMVGATEEDVTVVRVYVNGVKDGHNKRLEWEMIDMYDSGRNITSMARTTGFPAVILAEWIAQGRLPERGILAVEEVVTGERFYRFLDDLAKEGIHISFKETENLASANL
ncbi:saccharopine dehydrogenase family protein [Brevibacillus massiliensis]|uniref:saccharopine dehydrogenase family protein n=1 Tax=Brevibacillus massiliensis TaxID=1118054 RepID=UPI0002FB5AB9|nr:saccharopine dehydrogenase C-terminal domain-containing protein [Brevibacillus massiliensis]